MSGITYTFGATCNVASLRGVTLTDGQIDRGGTAVRFPSRRVTVPLAKNAALSRAVAEWRSAQVATKVPPARKAKKTKPEGKLLARRLRDATGHTQGQAAAVLGVSRMAWQAWELGQNPMPAPLAELYLVACAAEGLLKLAAWAEHVRPALLNVAPAAQ